MSEPDYPRKTDKPYHVLGLSAHADHGVLPHSIVQGSWEEAQAEAKASDKPLWVLGGAEMLGEEDSPPITPGVYRNTNTGVEFDLFVGADEVLIERGEGETKLTLRQERGHFWFNVQIGTYELVEAADEEPSDSDTTEAVDKGAPASR